MSTYQAMNYVFGKISEAWSITGLITLGGLVGAAFDSWQAWNWIPGSEKILATILIVIVIALPTAQIIDFREMTAKWMALRYIECRRQPTTKRHRLVLKLLPLLFSGVVLLMFLPIILISMNIWYSIERIINTDPGYTLILLIGITVINLFILLSVDFTMRGLLYYQQNF